MPAKAVSAASVPIERIQRAILVLRGEKVMLDSDLAALYGVRTKVLVQAMKRNASRFPPDFSFQTNVPEANALRSHFVTSKKGRGGRRYRPYIFTEQGVAMLSSVLRSRRAAEVNVAIMRAFVALRRLMADHTPLARKLSELERRFARHDRAIQSLFDTIRELMTPPVTARREMGFHTLPGMRRPKGAES